MSDVLGRVTDDQNIFQKLLGKLPGFKGYFDRQNRRSADKMLREAVANRFEEQWKRISSIQRDLISQGAIELIDDLEGAAIKIRQFIDRIRTASYGYAGFFDAAKINSEELAAVYQYDLAMITLGDDLSSAIDNVEASIGTDGVQAAIRNLRGIGEKCITVFNHRQETMTMSGGAEAAPQPPTPPAQ